MWKWGGDPGAGQTGCVGRHDELGMDTRSVPLVTVLLMAAFEVDASNPVRGCFTEYLQGSHRVDRDPLHGSNPEGRG
jgi:hypothetical protein